jgi:hypothetical protein
MRWLDFLLVIAIGISLIRKGKSESEITEQRTAGGEFTATTIRESAAPCRAERALPNEAWNYFARDFLLR